MKNSLAYTAVLLTSKTDLMREPKNAFPAIMLSIYCRSRMNGGIIPDIEGVFFDTVERGEIGISLKLAKRVLKTPSKLWEVVENIETGKKDLLVPFYSVLHEKAALNMTIGGRAGGLRSAAKRAQAAKQSARPKVVKNDEPQTFGATCGAPLDEVKSAEKRTQAAKNKENSTDSESEEKASPLASGAASKEKDIFLTEKYINSGCSSKDTHPAIDEAMDEDDSAPLSPQEQAAFFAMIRAELSKQETGEEQTGATENKTPETENAPERP